MKSPTTRGELRSARGAFVFIPEGTGQYLRVEPSLQLDPDFRRSSAEMVLTQDAKAIVESKRFKPVLEPEHGVPEKLIGDVVAQTGRDLVVETGENGSITIVVRAPGPETYSGRIICEMSGALEGHETVLRDDEAS